MKTHKGNKKYCYEIVINIIANILSLIPFIKNPQFSKESEYRIAEFVPSERLLAISQKPIYQVPKDRLLMIKNKYTNKEELAVKKEFNASHISSATFGSNINQKNNDNLHNLLDTHYPKASINDSKLPLRHMK